MTDADAETGTFIDLGATRTFTRRYCRWVPGEGAHGDTRAGTLRVVQQRNKTRHGDSSEVDSYGIVEVFENVDPPTRAFLVLNDTPPTAEGETRGEIYHVVAGRNGVSCTCRAGLARAPTCKHRDFTRLLISRGLL